MHDNHVWWFVQQVGRLWLLELSFDGDHAVAGLLLELAKCIVKLT